MYEPYPTACTISTMHGQKYMAQCSDFSSGTKHSIQGLNMHLGKPWKFEEMIKISVRKESNHAVNMQILNNHCKIPYISWKTWCSPTGHLQEIQAQKVPAMAQKLQSQAALLSGYQHPSNFADLAGDISSSSIRTPILQNRILCFSSHMT